MTLLIIYLNYNEIMKRRSEKKQIKLQLELFSSSSFSFDA